MKLSELETKAVNAMKAIVGDKQRLLPTDMTAFQMGYIFAFRIANGDDYIVKVWDDNSEPQVFKAI